MRYRAEGHVKNFGDFALAQAFCPQIQTPAILFRQRLHHRRHALPGLPGCKLILRILYLERQVVRHAEQPARSPKGIAAADLVTGRIAPPLLAPPLITHEQRGPRALKEPQRRSILWVSPAS